MVLLQSGKEGMGVIFGGGGSTSVFGGSGAGGFLVKITAFLSAIFLVTSLTYNYLDAKSRQPAASVMTGSAASDSSAPAKTQQAAPGTSKTPGSFVTPLPDKDGTTKSGTEQTSPDKPTEKQAAPEAKEAAPPSPAEQKQEPSTKAPEADPGNSTAPTGTQ